MYIAVKSIDFDKRTISLEVDRSITRGHFAHLTGFLCYCEHLGFSEIEIEHPEEMLPESLAMLREIQNARPSLTLSIGTPSEKPPIQTPDRCRLARVTRHREPGERAEYTISCGDMLAAVDDLTTTVLVLGYSIPLDQDTLSHLRLCLYELGANTVEHGTFHHGSPEITVTLIVEADHVRVEYTDNAGPFPTRRSKTVDIADKIKRRSKRGLGLFLLNGITEGLAYERDSTWNHTRFTVRRKKRASYHLNRRIDMNELSIAVTRTDCRDIVVLKPSGSITSSTVPQLDSAFIELTRVGQNTVVLDFSKTDFISSSGVGLLLGTVSSLRDKGGDLVLMNLPKLVNDIFDVLNIKRHFRIIEDLSELKVEARP